MNYLRNKAKVVEEESEESPPEVRKRKKKLKKAKSQKDFLQSNISSVQRRGSSSRLMKHQNSQGSSTNLSVSKGGENTLGVPSPRMSMRRASLQPLAVNRIQHIKSQKHHGKSSEHLLEDKKLHPDKKFDSVDDDIKEEKNDSPEKEEKKKLTGRALLLSLMKENVGEKDLTPEQKALHEAYHTLLNEYKRRKQLRQKTGVVFKRARSKIRNMLRAKSAWNGAPEGQEILDLLRKNKESDLQLKSRSQFLQKRKAAVRKQHHHVVNYSAEDRI